MCFGTGGCSARGTGPAARSELLLQKRVSVTVPTAVVLPVGMKNLEDCCVHCEKAYAGANEERWEGKSEPSLR